MTKNYIILAHKNPLQLNRMIEKLNDEHSYFYIHIDLKSDILDFKKYINFPNVHFIEKRENCLWGDFSIVRATINLMRQVKKQGRKGVVILMSGQDFPIKSNAEINSFFAQNTNTDFINITPIEKNWGKKMVRDKTIHYHILHSEKRGDSGCYAPYNHTNIKQKLRILFHRIKGKLSAENLKKLKTLPKRIPLFEKQYGGSQFWAFSEKTFQKILEYIDENEEKLENYYKYTSSSDEVYFHTILMYLKENGLVAKISSQVTYVNYFRKNNVFLTEDFEKLKKSNHLFARKFDMEQDENILHLIENSY